MLGAVVCCVLVMDDSDRPSASDSPFLRGPSELFVLAVCL